MSNDSPSKPPPIINVRGTKVGLGPFLPEHQQIYTKVYLQDPEIAIYGNGTFLLPAVSNLETPKPASSKEVIFTVFELEELTMIGESLLMDIDLLHGTATFGITIGNKAYWGKGYGTEASRLVLDYGFRFLNLHNIHLLTASFNTRAQRVYQKIGFKESGRRRGSILLNGQRYDDIYMDCLASEFESPTPGWYSLPPTNDI